METTIKKAVEGGYVVKKMEVKFQSYITGEHAVMTPDQPIQMMVLDPLFWQALGKSEGWEESKLCPIGQCPEWEWKMCKLMIHLASGGTIDEFFTNLLIK